MKAMPINSGGGDAAGIFDPGAEPAFKIGDIRASIPAHCWVKDTWRSLYYVGRDVAAAAGLMGAAVWLDSWAFWPLYWFAQGTIFWAIFVIGHDCGHGSFSDYPLVNDVVGHVLHSSILVPYHGWRISHRRHHQNHGHVDNDETWAPLPEKLYNKVDKVYKFFRYTFPLTLLAFPYYLVYRSPGKRGSHFNPYSQLFAAEDRKAVATSTVCWAAMCVFLLHVATLIGPSLFLNLYALPHLIFIGWIATVTYLHHHESQLKLPWYRGNQWTYLRGGLTTIDRDYGVFNTIHHDIGTHVVHHLFPQIPHYHLRDATKEAKKVMGDYYREPVKSVGPFPFHLLVSLARSIHTDHYVSNIGDVVYYQTHQHTKSN